MTRSSALILAAMALSLLAGGRLEALGQPVTPPGLVRGLMTDDTKILKEVGANSCLLWGVPGKPEAWDKLKQEGLFVFLNGLGEPPKEFFQYDGKKRVAMQTPFCYANRFGQWWAEHVGAAAAKHYPAIHNLTTDECAWSNAHIAYVFGIRQTPGTKFYCDCPLCQAAGPLPELTASRFLKDSPESRRFIQYRYQTLAKAIQSAQDQAKQANPDFLSYYTLNLREVAALERYPYGVALDLLPQADVLLATAFQAGPDRRGEEGRFVQPMVVKHLLAARPRLGAVPALAATIYDYREKFDWTEAYYWRQEVEDLLPDTMRTAIVKDLQPYTLRDDQVLLPALSCLGQGARGVMFFGEERKEALKQLFALMAKLEKPLADSRVPGKVVVLCSRQSEDQWMLSHAPSADSRADLSDAITQAGGWAQTANRIAWEYNRQGAQSQGFRSTQAVMQALIRQGIPFRLHFVESLQPSDLAEAQAVILPFCTHLSNETAQILQKTTAKLIVFAHRGEFDDKNQPRPQPALQPGQFIDQEADAALKDQAGRQRLAQSIGKVGQVSAAVESEEVERTWLQLKDGGVALFLLNWGDAPAQVRVQLPKPGNASVLSPAGTSESLAMPATVQLPAREARIVLQAGTGEN